MHKGEAIEAARKIARGRGQVVYIYYGSVYPFATYSYRRGGDALRSEKLIAIATPDGKVGKA